ncbi:MAG: hypothetical protein ABJD68_00975, partial [Nakamurella sp.]
GTVPAIEMAGLFSSTGRRAIVTLRNISRWQREFHPILAREFEKDARMNAANLPISGPAWFHLTRWME